MWYSVHRLACQPYIDLISHLFSCLKLKEQRFHVYEPCSLEEIDQFFGNIKLDPELKPHDMKTKLPRRPKLSQYLAHCGRERIYFISFKKCGSSNCDICLLPQLISQDCQRLNHLPNPMPNVDNQYRNVLKKFSFSDQILSCVKFYLYLTILMYIQ